MARRAIGPLTTLAVFGLALPALAQEASLPGGASTLNETHGAWTVICAIGTQAESRPVKYCAMSQIQLHAQTRQRALAIELESARGTACRARSFFPLVSPSPRASPIRSMTETLERCSSFAPSCPPGAWLISPLMPAPRKAS